MVIIFVRNFILDNLYQITQYLLMKKIFIILTLLWCVEIFSCVEGEGFFPPNKISISMDTQSNISEQEFNKIISDIDEIYQPIFKDKGLSLQSFANWRSSQVNARATRSGRVRKIIIFGGMGRHPLVNSDELSLIVCHEIGHHLGGAPKASAWASGEGQADYFATMKCLRKLFLKFPKTIDAIELPRSIVQNCQKSFANEADIQVCIRSNLAGLNIATLFSTLSDINAPDPNITDSNIVTYTNHRHPVPQCRFDTYSAGALCLVDHIDDFSSKDETMGACHYRNGDSEGLRPKCWFAPKR